VYDKLFDPAYWRQVKNDTIPLMRCYTPELVWHRSCLIWSVAAMIRLRYDDLDPQIRAGTMLWPRMREHKPNDLDLFGYRFRPTHPQSVALMAAGELPELHVWLEIPTKNFIVDLTTGYLPKACLEFTKLPWLNEPPPEYLFTKKEDIPERVIYAHDDHALSISIKRLNDPELGYVYHAAKFLGLFNDRRR